jgi:hypothetical protein
MTRSNGDVLIWVFPAMCLAYGAAYWLVGRHYGARGFGG